MGMIDIIKIKRTLRLLGVLVVILYTNHISFAQDIHFSQFFEAPLLRNPSLSGIFTGDLRVQAVYRDQWNSVTNAYRTGSLNGNTKCRSVKATILLPRAWQLLYDRAGTIGWTTTHLLPAINYHKSLSATSNRYLSLGFMGGLVQRRFDPFKDHHQYNYNGGGDGETFTNAQFSYLDGSVGLSYNADIRE